MNKRRRPRKITPQSLNNIALYHLQRYASSAENLRRVLMRRVERAGREAPTETNDGGNTRDTTGDTSDGATLVDALITRFLGAGLLDDRAYAEGRVISMHRRGNSARGIRAKLMQKGIDAETIEAALETLADQSPDPEMAAAVALARRRHLGPFGKARYSAAAENRRDKDMAAMARAGFSFAVARRVIECENAQELEDGLDADDR